MNADDLDTLDDQIRNALRARANLLTEADLSPSAAPRSDELVTEGSAGPRWRWGMPVLVAAAVAALAIGTTVVVRSVSADHVGPAGSTGAAPATTPANTIGTPESPPAPSRTVPVIPPSGSVGSVPAPPAYSFGYQPLWPFATLADAEAWRTGAGGSQPWHEAANQTALSFTRGYLGFTEVDRVTSVVAQPREAHIGVGYLDPNGKPRTAAVLHLLRFGSSARSPWEVVGSDDTTFSLELPAYGSAVRSPMTIGGHITGVDENIHVWVRSLSTAAPVGERCCLPAGGENSPWQQAIPFTGSGVLTIVASTGGHLQQVERFAIQGAHT
jgi:hypothetical protein